MWYCLALAGNETFGRISAGSKTHTEQRLFYRQTIMNNKAFPINALKIKLLVLLTTMMGLVIACNALSGQRQVKSISSQKLSFPFADYSSILWIGQEMIAFTTTESADNARSYAKAGDQNLHQIVFPDDPNCGFSTDHQVYETLPDGDLQLWKECRIGTTALPTKTLTYLMSYNWQTGKMEELAGPLPLGSSQASWNPDQTRGIVFLDSGLARTTLFSIWKNGFGPLDLVITDQEKSWNLKNFFPDFPNSETIRSGNTGRAVWSPDGHTIAFFASSDAIGKVEFERFNVEYNLYLMDADQLKPKAVSGNIHFPFIIKWSPDSRHIAFIGEYGSFKQTGLWLYSIDTNSVLNIAEGTFQDILWNPDNKGLFAIRCDDNHYCSQVEEYDLAGILNH